MAKRWTPQRKLQLIKLVQNADPELAWVALRDCDVSGEELESWIIAYARNGLLGLKATRRYA